MELVPVTLEEARLFVQTIHRHNRRPVGWRFGVGIASEEGSLVGVAVASNPVAPMIRVSEPRTIEIVRVCTLGGKNANSRLYGAICRAAAALGWNSAITYTLTSESGASLRASGFTCEGIAGGRPGQTWNVASRPRVEVNLFGEETTPNDVPKLRWRRDLVKRVVEKEA